MTSWDEFLRTPLVLDLDIVPAELRRSLDALPSSVHVLGDRVPLQYIVEDGGGAVQVRLREGQAKRVRLHDLPALDRPLRFVVVRGKREVTRARTVEGLHEAVAALPREPRRKRR